MLIRHKLNVILFHKWLNMTFSVPEWFNTITPKDNCSIVQAKEYVIIILRH
jgi:hypothetical protein